MLEDMYRAVGKSAGYCKPMPRPDLQHLFGFYLRRMRTVMGLNQVQFAKLIDVPQSYLSGLETGDLKPSMDAINSILDRLLIDMGAFLRGMYDAYAEYHKVEIRRGRPRKISLQAESPVRKK